MDDNSYEIQNKLTHKFFCNIYPNNYSARANKQIRIARRRRHLNNPFINISTTYTYGNGEA